MCGRFNILTDVDALMTTFEILEQDVHISAFEHRYNISPTPRNTEIVSVTDDSLSKIPIVTLGENRQRELRDAIWPLIPIWAGAMIPKYSTANARGETMAAKASFRNAWKKDRRCLVVATGFYEWQTVRHQRPKQPWHIKHKQQPIMSFAGIWESGYLPDGKEFKSCSIVTTNANSLMAEIHNSNKRMPVILDPEKQDSWLGGSKSMANELIKPGAEGQLEAYPISTKINYPKYSRADCIEPIEPNFGPTQPKLIN